MVNRGRGKDVQKTWMVTGVISCESCESSDWDTAAADAADQCGELKGSWLSSAGEGECPDGDPWVHGAGPTVCGPERGLRRVSQRWTYLQSQGAGITVASRLV